MPGYIATPVVTEDSRPFDERPSAYPALREDPLWTLSTILTKAKTIWMELTYPFAGFGRQNSIHYSCEIRRPVSHRIFIGDSVYIAQGTWLNVPEPTQATAPSIILENGCRIGRRCMISAKNQVHLRDNVLLGPSVLITDHSHQFSDIDIAIHAQGLTSGGTVLIDRNCWLGHGAAIMATSGRLVIGQNSVIGANAVVTRSVPPFSVVAGNPARVLRQYDPRLRKWVKAMGIEHANRI